MKKVKLALRNQFFLEDVRVNSSFIFYNLILTSAFLLTVWIIGSIKSLFIALSMMICFAICIVVLAMIFDKGDSHE